MTVNSLPTKSFTHMDNSGDKKSLINQIKTYKSDNVFNPYSDICAIHDDANSPKIRLENLVRLLDYFIDRGANSMWIARDFGYRGGRRTGITLTDEPHLPVAAEKWQIRLDKSTISDAVKENTATTVWDLLCQIKEPIFMWNVFPFHPHEEDNPYSNRRHNAKEQRFGMEILNSIVTLLRPDRIVAIGKDAHDCASKMFKHIPCTRVRHPSYGGKKEFTKQITELYQL